MLHKTVFTDTFHETLRYLIYTISFLWVSAGLHLRLFHMQKFERFVFSTSQEYVTIIPNDIINQIHVKYCLGYYLMSADRPVGYKIF